MEPEKKMSFTPLPGQRQPHLETTTITRPASTQEIGQEYNSSPYKQTNTHQQPFLQKSPASMPPSLTQKHWWTPQED